MYAEFAYDPKVQVLTETLQRRYVILLCLHSEGKLENKPDDEIALALRVTDKNWHVTKMSLIERGLLDAKTGVPTGWDKRQYISDIKDPTAAKRQSLYRQRKRNAPVTSRPPDSDTDTEREKDNTKVLSKKVSLDELSTNHILEWLSKKRAEGKYIHHNEFFILERFKDYCLSKGKKYNDYIAAYRNAFEWDTCQPKQQKLDPAATAHETAKSIIARRTAAAGIAGNTKPINAIVTADIRMPENVC